MSVLARNARRAVPFDAALLRRRAQAVLEALGVGRAELSLVVVGPRTMRRLNREHRGKNRPTDVLSFPQDEEAPTGSPEIPRLLGDVVICADVARRQAEERGADLDDELARLLIHGVLHLLGEDHETPAQARRMAARAAAVVRRMRARGLLAP